MADRKMEDRKMGSSTSKRGELLRSRKESTEKTEKTEQTENPENFPFVPSFPSFPYSLFDLALRSPRLDVDLPKNGGQRNAVECLYFSVFHFSVRHFSVFHFSVRSSYTACGL